jgi:hypothetical protein
MRVRSMSAVVVTAAVTMVGAACSAPAQNASSTTTSSSPSGAPPPTTTIPQNVPTLAVTPTTISPPAHVGGTVLIPPDGPNPAAQVTLVQVVDPGQGADQFAVPVAGDRFVGAQLRITMGGSGPVPIDVNAGTALEDTQGGLYMPSPANLVGCAAFNLGPAVSAGKSVLGCVTFEIGLNTRISDITFTPGGAFGRVSAEWQVP